MFFKNKNQINKAVAELLTFAEKVKKYRGDLFAESDEEELTGVLSDLKSADSDESKERFCDKLRNCLQRVGGNIFPKKGIVEFVELIVVAAILAGGIRAFFIQPFKIPTNSMFPTYNGMTSKVCFSEPGFIEKSFERFFYGALFYEFTSPFDGEVLIPLNQDKKRTHSSDIFEVFIGNNQLQLNCPRDFSIENVLLERFFPNYYCMTDRPFRGRWSVFINDMRKNGKITITANGVPVIKTGTFVKVGDKFLNFKIFIGDMVLVNKLLYNFLKPSVGDPFVFRTNNIAGLNNEELYYIKRLAGTSGDRLRVSAGKLYRNDEIISGSKIFDKNNNVDHKNGYYGYLPEIGSAGVYSLPLNKDYTVPEGYCYALGDNSSNSYDSRGWGLVPADDVVGKALFVLYPLSKRWGIAE